MVLRAMAPEWLSSITPVSIMTGSKTFCEQRLTWDRILTVKEIQMTISQRDYSLLPLISRQE